MFHSWLNRWDHSRFIQAANTTLSRLRPYILAVGIIDALSVAVFSADGFFAAVYHLKKRIPNFGDIHHIAVAASSLFNALLLLAILALFTQVLAKNAQTQTAPLTAVVCLIILTVDPGRLPIVLSSALGLTHVLVALLLGFAIVWLFERRIFQGQRRQVTLSFVVILLAMLGTLTSHTLIIHLTTNLWPHLIIPQNMPGRVFLMPLANTFVFWTGLPPLIPHLQQFGTGVNATANLNYALAHNSLAHVPHLVTMTTTYASFASMGGAGMVLALLLAIWLKTRRAPLGALLPALVNLPQSALLAIPLMLDPIFLIPMLLAPLAAQLIAAAALVLHIMPPAVYAVPATTPGFLVAFLGTNGNWAALIVSLVALAVATAICLPFVSLRMRRNSLEVAYDA